MTNRLRLQITPSPNPSYIGYNAFDLWVADPRKLLTPIPKARVTLKLVAPSDSTLPPTSNSVKTDKEGKAVAHLDIAGGGVWTLQAKVTSAQNGSLSMTGRLPVRALPGQVDHSPRKPVAPQPVGPLRSLAPPPPGHPKSRPAPKAPGKP